VSRGFRSNEPRVFLLTEIEPRQVLTMFTALHPARGENEQQPKPNVFSRPWVAFQQRS
jgi:hypothetical protein